VALCSDGLEVLDDALSAVNQNKRDVARVALANAAENFNHIWRLMVESRKATASWPDNASQARKMTVQFCQDGLEVTQDATRAVKTNNRDVARVGIAEARTNFSAVWRLLVAAANPERADQQQIR
jgi:acetyl-CoA acetyltransferase